MMPVRQAAGNFVDRFRAVPAAGYATAVCILWVVTFIMGAWIYTRARIWKYRMLYPHPDRARRDDWLEDQRPAYRYFMEARRTIGNTGCCRRKWLTRGARRHRLVGQSSASVVNDVPGFGHEHVIVWYAFLVGHVINNVRGFGS